MKKTRPMTCHVKAALLALTAGLVLAGAAMAQPEDPMIVGDDPADAPQAEAPAPAPEGEQPERPRDQRPGARGPGERPGDQRPMDPESLRQRLMNRIEESRRQIERSEAALEALDKGVPADQVMNDMNAEKREGPLAAQERERIRAFVQEHMPRLWERIEAMEKKSPQRTERMFMNMRERVGELIVLKRRDPKLFGLKLDDWQATMMAMEAARDVRELRAKGGSAEEIAAGEQRVRELVSQSVDVQLKLKSNELEMLGKRIERLHKELDDQTADRDKIIQQRTKRIMNAGSDRPPPPGAGQGAGDRPPGEPRRRPQQPK